MASVGTVKMLTTDMGIDALKVAARMYVNDERTEIKPIWPNFMRKKTFNEYIIEYGENGGFGDIPLKDEGDYINFGLMDMGDLATIQPEVRQLAFAITKQDRKYNKIGKVERASKMLARAARRTMERIAAYPLNVATSTVRRTIDQLALVSSSHVMINGTVVSNNGGAVDLAPATLEAALIAWSKLQDNDGTFISLMPEFLVVPPDLAPIARRILRSQNYPVMTSGVPSGADTGVPNATILDAGLTLVVDPYLTDTNAWFLLAPKSQHELQMYENEAFNDRSFVDPYTEDYVYSVEFSNIAAAADWKGIYGAQGST